MVYYRQNCTVCSVFAHPLTEVKMKAATEMSECKVECGTQNNVHNPEKLISTKWAADFIEYTMLYAKQQNT